MAQLEQRDDQHAITSSLKIDDKGWDIKLFADSIKLSGCICANCRSVCCDAVELGCDHDDDDDIFLYCNHCLKQLINDNDNKCPIDGHIDPVIIPNRASRRQISKAVVLCPHSAAYKTANNELSNKNDNGQIIDTIDGDEKEGDQDIAAYQQYINKDECQWSGTLNDLIKKHLTECAKKYNPTFILNVKINSLENKNNELNQQILTLQSDISNKDAMNNQLQNKVDQQDKLVIDLQNEINSLKQENKELKEQLNKQFDLMQDVINNKQEEMKNNDDININQKTVKEFEFVIPETNKQYFTKRDKNALCYKGSMFSSCRWCKFGGVLMGNDNVTIHIDTGIKGIGGNYAFGFASTKCTDWKTGWPRHAAVVDGDKYYRVKDEFKNINDVKLIKQQLESMTIFNKSDSKNVVIMSVNMKQKLGWIWNKNNTECKVEFKLPEAVFFVVMVAGTGDKMLAVTKVITK